MLYSSIYKLINSATTCLSLRSV